MKRIRLGVKTSESGNMTYNIYRSTSQQDLPDSVEVLNVLTPLMIVQESLLAIDATNITEDLLPDKSKAPRGLKTPYKLDYPPLCSSIQNFILTITDTDTSVETSLDITFLNSGVISGIAKTVVDGEDIVNSEQPLEDIEFLSENIYITELLLNGNKTVSGSYYIKLINVSDDNESVIEGINYTGPVATGIGTPDIDVINGTYQVNIDSFIPIINLIATGADDGIVYYYRIVAEDTIGNVSDPSPLFSILLQQNVANVTYKIEYTFDIDVLPEEEVVWHTLIQAAVHGTDYLLGQPGTDLYEEKGAIVESEVAHFSSSSIDIDDANVETNNVLLLTIPNVWKENNPTYNLKKSYSIRSVATDTHGNFSEVSEVIPAVNVNVSMEKIVCVKKEVSEVVEQDAPISIEDPDAEIIKQWIKDDGIYFNPIDHAGFPTNLQLTNSPICLMTIASTFDTLIHTDNDVAINHIYNYTFHIFDVYGNYATVVRVVDTTVTP